MQRVWWSMEGDKAGKAVGVKELWIFLGVHGSHWKSLNIWTCWKWLEDREAGRDIVQEVTKSQTWLSNRTTIATKMTDFIYYLLYDCTRSSLWAPWFSCCRAGALEMLPQGMWDLSSPARDQTSNPCIARQILNHWTMRQVLPKDWLCQAMTVT